MRTFPKVLAAAIVATAALVGAAPAAADDTQAYIDCMNRAITHKDSMLATPEPGVPAAEVYREAMQHYYELTRGCFSYFFLGGPRIVEWDDPFPLPFPPQYIPTDPTAPRREMPLDIPGSGYFGGGWLPDSWIWGSAWGSGGGWGSPFDYLLALADQSREW